MYLMKNNDEMLLDDKMLKFVGLFQNTMIVQMDMKLIQHYLHKAKHHPLLFLANRIIYMHGNFLNKIQSFFVRDI